MPAGADVQRRGPLRACCRELLPAQVACWADDGAGGPFYIRVQGLCAASSSGLSDGTSCFALSHMPRTPPPVCDDSTREDIRARVDAAAERMVAAGHWVRHMPCIISHSYGPLVHMTVAAA